MFLFRIAISYSADSYHKCSTTPSASIFHPRSLVGTSECSHSLQKAMIIFCRQCILQSWRVICME